MLTAMRMDCLVCLQYLKRSLATSAIMAACLVLGMGSFTAIPGTIFLVSIMGITISAYSYDERNGWAAYRATLPILRRDMVLGRYLATLAMALVEYVLALALCLLLVGVMRVVEAPGMLEATFAWNSEQAAALALSSSVCVAIGMVIMAVSHVVALRFGMTKAMQYVPGVLCVLGLLPVFVPLLFMGEETRTAVLAQLGAVLESGGLLLIPVVCLTVAGAAYALSAAIGVRVSSAASCRAGGVGGLIAGACERRARLPPEPVATRSPGCPAELVVTHGSGPAGSPR